MNITAQTAQFTEKDVQDRLAFMGLDEQNRDRIRSLKPIVERDLPKGLDRFYSIVAKTPEVSRFFSTLEHMNGAKHAQIGHWAAITTGKFDEDYAKRVRTIGAVHARIGLEPRWYIGGYALILEQLVRGIAEEHWPKGGLLAKRDKAKGEDFVAALVALLKAVMLDMDLSISVYIDEAEAARKKAEQEAKDAMERIVSCFGEAIGELSAKNLSHRIETRLDGSYEDLRNQYNSTIAELADTMQRIGQAAEAINSGSQEVGSAAGDLSGRAERQAAAVEETAAAVEEITASVKSSAGRAEEAGRLVDRTRKNAEQSGDIVRKAVEAMDRISKSSDNISNIIGVIDEIAFQTNLLALNAGVEAARAGDAGKGFAVVAQEVRELAQRSASAAKEIKALITASGDEVKNGVSLVGETGLALEGIASEVQEIAGNVEAIIESAREQSSSLHEVNAAVSSVDQGTQQNAAMAEELTASSHSLASEVEQISSMLGEFHTGRPAAMAKPAPAPVAVPAAARIAAKPRPSPARDLTRKVANAFGERTAPQANDWEEF